MNLVNGKVIQENECSAVLDSLAMQIQETIKKPRLDPMTVVQACDTLSRTMNEEAFQQSLMQLGIPAYLIGEYISEARLMLNREYLMNKLQSELGADDYGVRRYQPPFYDKVVVEKMVPLGVLFHIAAGNSAGLPVYSIIEGLLTGNINILKLPRAEGGITVEILLELFRIEPTLAEYVYVFDYSSKDLEAMKVLSELADAIVVWGGDATIKSVREMAAPNTKIIEWGHKISFAYVSGDDVTDEALEGIARNICQTNQQLCSSCQGIFIDTDLMDEIHRFCQRFLPILEKVSKELHSGFSIGMEAQNTLYQYTESLKSIFDDTQVFQGDHCSITAYTDSSLSSSVSARSCWVKRLPRNKIVAELRPYKSHLQTVGLVSDEGSVAYLTEAFWRTGVVRITDGSHMSKIYNGAARDGEYSLRRYIRGVVYEE